MANFLPRTYIALHRIASTACDACKWRGWPEKFLPNMIGGITCGSITHQLLCSASYSISLNRLRYSLFLGLVIDRLHHYIRQIRTMKKSMEAVTKQSKTLEEAKLQGAEEIQGYQKKISSLNEQVQAVKHQYETKTEELKTAEANTLALRKQSEGLLTEYERLIAENEELRNKLQSMEVRFSHSDGKKNS
ncbi:hypothetical protein BRADI_5g16730v3 [Brachypodium distachyon]|uniref:Endoplasmic reticulum transmembrane protein n=1 Tax=Brachypodium distachyon TaxID=15368 RepID=A0A2K2CHQ7_BRADI|nr:hypothetical protein BRADI_5g16730v3 [Brachypodium distachyon]